MMEVDLSLLVLQSLKFLEKLVEKHIAKPKESNKFFDTEEPITIVEIDNQLKRSKQIQKEYDNYQKNPFNNHIFSRNLFYNNDILVFIKNRFPYNVADNIAHYVLFINPY